MTDLRGMDWWSNKYQQNAGSEIRSSYALLKSMLFLAFTLMLLSACEETAPLPPEPVGGREAEAHLSLSGEQWFPDLIAFSLTETEDNTLLSLDVSSIYEKGFYRYILMTITANETLNIPPDGSLDLSQIEEPAYAEGKLLQFLDNRNLQNVRWVAGGREAIGIRIDSMQTEDGVRYASGEFSMYAINDDALPRLQEITGIFNNVRVFTKGSDRESYFNRLTAYKLHFED